MVLIANLCAAQEELGAERNLPPESMGSAYVPLDGWAYPAIERLAGWGYVGSGLLGLKPWTRMECARLVSEAVENQNAEESRSGVASRLLSDLQREFAVEMKLLGGERNLGVQLESVYARGLSISGPPLIDSYHFGQTLAYDFGRPFRRGMNLQIGGGVSATAGPLAFYIRGEFQHSPPGPALSQTVRNFIAAKDQVPALSPLPFRAINQLQLLDAYGSYTARNWQLSAGRQSLSWAPGPGGSLLWSNNIAPVTMLRLTNPMPLRLPGILRFLGPVRTDQFFGRLAGHSYIPKPFIYGQKFNFKPFSCLELGFGRSITIGGQGGAPLTWGNFLDSFTGQVSPSAATVPGDAHVGMDWNLVVPKLRNYLVFYGEVYADDDFIPWQNPPKNPFRTGIYLTRIPGVPKLDFHLEAVSTESPWEDGRQGKLNYWNMTYHDGYTNRGYLIGNSVGRMGRAIQFWATYWLSARNTVQFAYKHSTVSADFIPGGGAWQDYAVQGQTFLRSGWYVKSMVQYEHIARYPLLFTGAQNNLTAVLEMGFSFRGK